ncbi:hypothetical protein Pcinc_043558, partial [Petrolisthes cinctipes]
MVIVMTVMMVLQYNTDATPYYNSPPSRVYRRGSPLPFTASKYLPYIVLPLVEEMLVGENIVLVVGPVSKNKYMVLSPPLLPTPIYYTYSSPPSEEWSYLGMGRQGNRREGWKSDDNNNNNNNNNKSEAEHEPFIHFHQEGLAASHHTLFYQKLNRTAEVNTLSGHVNKFALNPRLIHILK